jgi:hypothetical protein
MEAVPQINKLQTSGGFRIETYPDEVLVTKAVSGKSPTVIMRSARYLA